MAIGEQVKAYGGPKYQVLQDIVEKYTKAIESGQIQIVPNTLVTMGKGDEGTNINPLEAFITLLLSKELDSENSIFNKGENLSKELEQFRKELFSVTKPQSETTNPTVEEGSIPEVPEKPVQDSPQSK